MFADDIPDSNKSVWIVVEDDHLSCHRRFINVSISFSSGGKIVYGEELRVRGKSKTLTFLISLTLFLKTKPSP